MLEQFKDLLVRILLLAALVSFVSGPVPQHQAAVGGGSQAGPVLKAPGSEPRAVLSAIGILGALPTLLCSEVSFPCEPLQPPLDPTPICPPVAASVCPCPIPF